MTTNISATTGALVFNGLGLWAVAAAILWTGLQPHTVLLGGDPKHLADVRVSSDVSGGLTLDSGIGGFSIEAGNTTFDVNLNTPSSLDVNLDTTASGLDVNVNQK